MCATGPVAVQQAVLLLQAGPLTIMLYLSCTPGIDTLCPALESSGDDDRPVYQISYLVMQLLGPTVWEAGNKMREYHERATQAAGSDSESDDLSSQETSNVHRLHASTSQRAPLPEWIITTGKGMLKASSPAACFELCLTLQVCLPAAVIFECWQHSVP